MVVECLPRCLPVGATPTYPPVTIGAYRAERYGWTAGQLSS
jgi:hypothetical protein